MENPRPTTTVDRSGRPPLVPWNALEAHVPTAFTVAGASLVASLFVPLGLSVVIEWSWLAGIGGLVVLALAGLTGAAMKLPSLGFSVGKQAFVVLALTMAGGYGLGFLAYGASAIRSSEVPGRAGTLLAGGGVLLLLPVLGGVLELGYGLDMPAWVVFLSIGLVAMDTVTVGISLRSTS